MNIARKIETVYLSKTEMDILTKAREILEDIIDSTETYELQDTAQSAVEDIDALLDEEDLFKVCMEKLI